MLAAHADGVQGLGGAEGCLSPSCEFPRGSRTDSMTRSSIQCWKKIIISLGRVLLSLVTSGIIFQVKVLSFNQAKTGRGFFSGHIDVK